MGAKYDHFTLEERRGFCGLMEMGLGASEITRPIGRPRGRIYPEISRDRCASGYRPDSADRMASVRKVRGSKLQRSTRLAAYVGNRLLIGWSPEEIAGLRELEAMNDTISAEFIYRCVYSPAGRLGSSPHSGLVIS